MNLTSDSVLAKKKKYSEIMTGTQGRW